MLNSVVHFYIGKASVLLIRDLLKYEVTAYHTPPFILITFTPVLVCVPQCLCGGRRTTFWSGFLFPPCVSQGSNSGRWQQEPSHGAISPILSTLPFQELITNNPFFKVAAILPSRGAIGFQALILTLARVLIIARDCCGNVNTPSFTFSIRLIIVFFHGCFVTVALSLCKHMEV